MEKTHANYIADVVQAIVVRATREDLWTMRLDDIDLHAMAEEILDVLDVLDVLEGIAKERIDD